MLTVQIEHPIRDFKSWRAAFDSDPAGREKAGVRRYRILRPLDDPNRIIVDLDFDSPSEAEAFVAAMRQICSFMDSRSPARPLATVAERLRLLYRAV